MSDERIHNPAITVTEDDRGLYVTGGFCPPLIDYDNLPPALNRRPNRRTRLRWWRHRLDTDIRERLALRLAPWLERDPYE